MSVPKILAGLLPMTFARVGTRDAALIFFYRVSLSLLARCTAATWHTI